MATLVRNHPLLEMVNITASNPERNNLGGLNTFLLLMCWDEEIGRVEKVSPALQELNILCSPDEAASYDEIGSTLGSILSSSAMLKIAFHLIEPGGLTKRQRESRAVFPRLEAEYPERFSSLLMSAEPL